MKIYNKSRVFVIFVINFFSTWISIYVEWVNVWGGGGLGLNAGKDGEMGRIRGHEGLKGYRGGTFKKFEISVDFFQVGQFDFPEHSHNTQRKVFRSNC